MPRPQPTVKHNLTGNPSGEQCSPLQRLEKVAVYLTRLVEIETFLEAICFYSFMMYLTRPIAGIFPPSFNFPFPPPYRKSTPFGG